MNPWSSTSSASVHDELVNELLDTITSERRRIGELHALMLEQRQAIACEDVARVDDSVFAVQRILLTMSEARIRRLALCRKLGCEEPARLRNVLVLLGQRAPDELHHTISGLENDATALAREIAVNREILRHEMQATDDHVRILATAGEPSEGYPDPRGMAAAARENQLVSRQV